MTTTADIPLFDIAVHDDNIETFIPRNLARFLHPAATPKRLCEDDLRAITSPIAQDLTREQLVSPPLPGRRYHRLFRTAGVEA